MGSGPTAAERPAPHRPQISSQTQISEIDTLMYFKPFLSIIQSDQTSGARPGQREGIRLSASPYPPQPLTRLAPPQALSPTSR